VVSDWLDITPAGVRSQSARSRIMQFAAEIEQRDGNGEPVDEATLESQRVRFLSSLASLRSHDRQMIDAVICVLTDLAKQGWRVRVSENRVEGLRPSDDGVEVRSSRRRQLSARRNEQLREDATRQFVAYMERGHLFRGRRVSIFSLMRDGRELTASLAGRASGGRSDTEQRRAIEPYLQIVESDATCGLTGLKLVDVWRYFRHTWSTPYESVPGRSMQILVRDRAAPAHPVIGIAALSSAASVLPVRDEKFIRWTGESMIADLKNSSARRKSFLANWVVSYVDESIATIFKQDFVEDGLIPSRLTRVAGEQIARLLVEGKRAKDQHFAQTRDASYIPAKGHGGMSDEYWETQARTPLFRSKRALELADLLGIRQVVNDAFKDERGADRLDSLLSTSRGRTAFGKVVKRARSAAIGSAIADLTVCGAIAPYNELVGGKLVALLCLSPEVIHAYRKRYTASASVIGSSMAGRRLVRDADLVFVGTTSLYGLRPNQYDRALIPCEALGRADGKLGFRYLGDTLGYGTSQFSESTKLSIERLVSSQLNGKTVNNVFGEGANPRLRALREGLEHLGLPEELLVHGQKKCVYGATLVDYSTLRDYLLGIVGKPRYMVPKANPRRTSERMANWWFERWARDRSRRPDVLERIRSHAIVYPIRHGARVDLPEANVDQLSLFSMSVSSE
jgi:hypothetical protein